jgi:hypothetical protein
MSEAMGVWAKAAGSSRAALRNKAEVLLSGLDVITYC